MSSKMESKTSISLNGRISNKYEAANDVQNDQEQIFNGSGKKLKAYHQTLVFFVNGKEVS